MNVHSFFSAQPLKKMLLAITFLMFVGYVHAQAPAGVTNATCVSCMPATNSSNYGRSGSQVLPHSYSENWNEYQTPTYGSPAVSFHVPGFSVTCQVASDTCSDVLKVAVAAAVAKKNPKGPSCGMSYEEQTSVSAKNVTIVCTSDTSFCTTAVNKLLASGK